MEKYDEYDEEVSAKSIEKLEDFRDVTMGAKIAQARSQIEFGVTKLERDIKGAYEAVKLQISQIQDHHF